MAVLRRAPLSEPPGTFVRTVIPILAVVLGSLMVLVPVIAIMPLMPPFGLLMLIAWRVPRPGLWPVWTGLPLGLFDDLCSGAPIGTAMALWTVTLLLIDYADMRLIWRDYWQDWALAALAVAGCVTGAWLIAEATGGATPFILMVPLIVTSALLYPILARACAALDQWRFAR